MKRYYDGFDYDAWKEECERHAGEKAYEQQLDWLYKTGPYEIKESSQSYTQYERPDEWYEDEKNGYYDEDNELRNRGGF